MNIIATKFLNDIKYLLGSALTAPNMYRQIKAAFPGSDVFKIFAEPVVLEGGRKVSWVSQYSGNAVNYNYLSDEDKEEKILENPQIIRTPVVRNGKKATIGYCPDVWKEWD